jgi:hypothetical protein
VTRLDKPVTREAKQFHRGRPLVVKLDPAGYVEIHPKGKRTEVYRLTFDQIMQRAAWFDGAPQRADRARERRQATR